MKRFSTPSSLSSSSPLSASSPQLHHRTITALQSAAQILATSLHRVSTSFLNAAETAIDYKLPLFNQIKNLHFHDVMRTFNQHNAPAADELLHGHVVGHNHTVFSVALSRVVEGLDNITRTLCINNQSVLYQKIAAFLMIYDYCKSELRGKELDSILNEVIDSSVMRKGDQILNCQHPIKAFIHNLTEHYSKPYANTFVINLQGYELLLDDELFILKENELQQASFSVQITDNAKADLFFGAIAIVPIERAKVVFYVEAEDIDSDAPDEAVHVDGEGAIDQETLV